MTSGSLELAGHAGDKHELGNTYEYVLLDHIPFGRQAEGRVGREDVIYQLSSRLGGWTSEAPSSARGIKNCFDGSCFRLSRSAVAFCTPGVCSRISGSYTDDATSKAHSCASVTSPYPSTRNFLSIVSVVILSARTLS